MHLPEYENALKFTLVIPLNKCPIMTYNQQRVSFMKSTPILVTLTKLTLMISFLSL